MADGESNTNQSDADSGKQAQSVVDRLVFAALKEQTRARRWRVGFMLFFIADLSVVTTTLFIGKDGGLTVFRILT